ncbi:MAG: Eco57I restriction-modification methylase domain-containing protein, partial [Candidatus Acidifodinimicrobium sp.]
RMGGGWVDFILPSSKEFGLPVALELKALHRNDGSLESLENEYRNLREQAERNHTNQVIRYILGARDPGNRGVDYVVLTNLKEVFIFDKGCIREFAYVKKETFREFIEGASTNRNIYDYLRRTTEDTERRDLDKQFFNDLKKWYGLLSNLEWIDNPESNSVLLLNKLIFALTLEDFMIIDYRKTWDLYSEKYNSWITKGAKKVLKEFFEDLDEFLYEYYDTELFIPSNDILSKLKDKKENYQNFLNVLGKVAGFKEDPETFSGGLYSYSFRLIDEDIFGKSYEMFLAENRKDQGIYYTPKVITKRMASKLVNELFGPVKERLLKHIESREYEEALSDARRLVEITILDPACGSGPFLISVLREISAVYEEIKEKTEWVHNYSNGLEIPQELREWEERIGDVRRLMGFDKYKVEGVNREALSKIVLRHIYGIDLDGMALNVAKVNLWKETVKINPSSYHFQSLPESINHILPNLNMNFIKGNSIVSLPEEMIVKILSEEFRDDIGKMVKLRNEYIEDPTRADIPDEIERIKSPIRERLREEFMKLYGSFESNPLFYPLEFFFLYFDGNGDLTEGKKGFTGVIGNPPWNNIKPIKKEFAAKHPEIFGEDISKFSIPGKEFEKLFEEKMNDPDVCREWKAYEDYYDNLSDYIKNNYKLHYSGDYSFQKVFLEKFIEKARDGFAILIPSNFHTDEGSYLLRKEILDNWEMRELISFENRRKNWFPAIDSRFKFDMLIVSSKKTGRPFKARFYINDEGEIDETFEYPIPLIGKLSPSVLGITEFRSENDIKIVSKIRGDHKLLGDMGIVLTSEFHTTNDKDLFNTNGKGLPVLKGENIHQYNPRYSTEISYWIEEEKGRERLLKKELSRIEKIAIEYGRSNGLKQKELHEYVEQVVGTASEKFAKREFILDYEAPRLAYRSIARSTDER